MVTALVLNCGQASVDRHRPSGRRLLETPLGTLLEVSCPFLLRGAVSSEEACVGKALGANRMHGDEEPLRIPITDVFDLHTVEPREVAAW